MSARLGLEHRLWRVLKNESLLSKRFLLACSGGADSVALVRAFAAVRPPESLTVCHIHHGPGAAGHRERAAGFVAALARELGVEFEMRRHEGEVLRSEQDLRRFRRSALEEVRRSRGADLIVTAHHREDLLETRLIRLLRGTGPDGFKAIHVLKHRWFRPFLDVSREDLRFYLHELAQDHLEDPSNGDLRFLRNWMRLVWLESLEARRPGAVDALGRSLENLSAALVQDQGLEEPILPRAQWETAAPAARLRWVAALLRAAGQNEMTRGQLEEIGRRLDNVRKEHRFTAAGCDWLVNAQRILVRKQGSSL